MPEDYATEKSSSKRSYSGSENPSKRSQGGKPKLKILIPNFLAGDIIGKQGSKRVELEAKYGCVMSFSRNKCFYPDTDQRIISFSGDLEDLKDLHNYIIRYLEEDAIKESRKYDNDHQKEKLVVKIVCPNVCGGLIIGPGGAKINALQEETSTKINVSRPEESAVPTERIIKIYGDLENRMEAANRITEIIAEHPENIKLGNIVDYSNVNVNERMIGGDRNFPEDRMPPLKRKFEENPRQRYDRDDYGNAAPLRFDRGDRSTSGSYGGCFIENTQNVAGGSFPNNSVSQIDTTITVKMKIPEVLVGALMANQGQTLREVIDFSGAEIQLTPKMESGPRILTIDGGENQSLHARYLINQKVKRALDAMNQAF